MKKTFMLAAALFAATAVSSKTLEITVPNVRSDKGSILVMAAVPGTEKPVYGMSEAREGVVNVTLDIPGDTAEVSLFHDENGNYQMDMGDRGPTEGYAAKKCTLADERTAVKMNLFYPTVNQ